MYTLVVGMDVPGLPYSAGFLQHPRERLCVRHLGKKALYNVSIQFKLYGNLNWAYVLLLLQGHNNRRAVTFT